MYKRLFSDSSVGDAEDGEEYDDPFAGPPDTVSLASERYDKDDEAHSEGMWYLPSNIPLDIPTQDSAVRRGGGLVRKQ